MEEFRNPLTHRESAAPAQHSSAAAKRRASLSGTSLKTWLIVLAVLLLAGAVGTAAYYISRYHDSQKQVQKLSNPTEAAKLEQQQLLDKVGALTVLPKGETPTIATVTDITKLKDQAFFVSAQNGDKVLIYTQAKKAILYRPSTNKIINIAPVNLGNGQASSGTTPTQTTTTTTNKSR